MKQLSLVLLAYVFLITNSCNHSKITLGQKHRHHRTEEEASKDDTPTAIGEIALEDVEEEPTEEPTINENKRTIEEVAIEQFDLIVDEETSEAFHRSLNKRKLKTKNKENSEQINQDQSRNQQNSTGLIVFGVILLLGGVALTLYAIHTLSNSDNSPDGCLTALVIGALLVIFAAVVGILGMIFLIVGLSKALSK